MDIKVYIIKVDIVDKSFTSVDELRIAKWENSFNDGTPVTVKNEFIDPDDDRFYIEVNDASKAGDATVLARISTDSPASPYADYDDPANDVTLYAVAGSPGKFRSKSMFLVSNQTDDAYPAGTDEQTTDRTHLIALGGEAIVEYPASDPIAEKRAEVLAKGAVTVNIVNMRKTVGGELSTPSSGHIDAVKQWTTEAYAQVGTAISFTYSEKDPPAGVDLTDGLLVQIAYKAIEPGNQIPTVQWFYLDQEFRTLVDAYGSPGQMDDIHLFIVPKAVNANIWNGVFSASTVIPGMGLFPSADTWTNSNFSPPPNVTSETENYFNNIVVSVDHIGGMPDYSCVSHELGHVLTDKSHETASEKVYNIMFGGGDVFWPFKVTDRKRLNEYQEGIIRTNGY